NLLNYLQKVRQTPSTIDKCFVNTEGEVPGIREIDKEEDGVEIGWNLKGHKNRIVDIGNEELKLFSKIYDSEETTTVEARLPALHSKELVSVLRKFSEQPLRLYDYSDNYFSTQHWNETTAQKDGTIERKTIFPEKTSDFILSGPHIFVANPLYKTPRQKCTNNSHYDEIDLQNISNNYIPRTNYIPKCDRNVYRERTPHVDWSTEDGKRKEVTQFYRLAFRAMLPSSGERTLTRSMSD